MNKQGRCKNEILPMTDWNLIRSKRLEDTQLLRQLAIIEATTDLVATVDIDGFLISLNAAGYDLLGFMPNAEINTVPLVNFFTKDSAEAFISTIIPKAVAHGSWHSETNIKGPGDINIPCSLLLVAHKDNIGNIEFFSVILRSIKSIKDAEEDRKQLMEQLHQSKKMETVGRLAGGVAHDFNNLITVIMGYAELALLNDNGNVNNHEELEIIQNTAQKAARLSNQLLDFSCKRMIESQDLGLNEVIADSQQLVESLLGESVKLKLFMDENLWNVMIDRSQLEQIILNFTVNAKDAMKDNGTFELITENIVVSELDTLLLGVLKAGEYVRLTARDNGCGIPEEELSSIFDPFFTTKDKGTGLGLSAVYGAVTQNKGQIKVHSIVGGGTTFEIFFPRSNESEKIQSKSEKEEYSSAQEVGSENILLVEDKPEVLKLLSTILVDQGYCVFEACDGSHALQVYDQCKGKIDLLVSDVLMPKLNGLGLYNELKEKEPDMKVLFISGHTDQVGSPEDFDGDKVRLLSKPFPPQRLAKEVHALLN